MEGNVEVGERQKETESKFGLRVVPTVPVPQVFPFGECWGNVDRES